MFGQVGFGLFNTAAQSPVLLQIHSQLTELVTDCRATPRFQHLSRLALGKPGISAKESRRHTAQ
jgi:hypothetical protein